MSNQEVPITEQQCVTLLKMATGGRQLDITWKVGAPSTLRRTEGNRWAIELVEAANKA